MEELIQKLNEFIDAIKSSPNQQWLTWIGILVPVAISIIAIIIDIVLNVKNRKLQNILNDKTEVLQKQISNRDVKTQMHGDFLKVYDDYCSCHMIIASANNGIEYIFINPQNALAWLDNLQKSTIALNQACNRVCLLIPNSDKEFLEKLQNLCIKINQLFEKCWNYYNSFDAINHYNNVWNNILTLYNIPYQNFPFLYSNIQAYQAFLKLYSNDTTNEINGLIKEILPLFANDKFDKYFEPYVKIDYNINN